MICYSRCYTNREIYLEHLIILIKISVFGARYRFSYRTEKNRDISPYRFIVPPILKTVHKAHQQSSKPFGTQPSDAKSHMLYLVNDFSRAIAITFYSCHCKGLEVMFDFY